MLCVCAQCGNLASYMKGSGGYSTTTSETELALNQRLSDHSTDFLWKQLLQIKRSITQLQDHHSDTSNKSQTSFKTQ